MATCALLPFSLGLSQALPRRPIPPGGGRAAGTLRPMILSRCLAAGQRAGPCGRRLCPRAVAIGVLGIGALAIGKLDIRKARLRDSLGASLQGYRRAGREILTTPAARRKAWTQEGFALALYQDDAKPRPSPTKWRGSHRIGLRGEQFSSHEAPAPQGLALLSPAALGLLVRCSATTLTPRCLSLASKRG